MDQSFKLEPDGTWNLESDTAFAICTPNIWRKWVRSMDGLVSTFVVSSKRSRILTGMGYFFETDMLIHLYYLQAVVADVQIPDRYGGEESHLSPFRAFLSFPGKLMGAFVRRILWRYFIHDFTAASVFFLAGSMLFLGGFAFGAVTWISSWARGVVATTGTVMLSVVPLFIGFQLLLQAIVLDISDVPRIPIHSRQSQSSGDRESSERS